MLEEVFLHVFCLFTRMTLCSRGGQVSLHLQGLGPLDSPALQEGASLP